MLSKLQSVHLCCLVLTIATPYSLIFLSILFRCFKMFKMQPDQYLEHPDLSTSHHSSRTFTGCLSIGESCTKLLHYVILPYLALALNNCLFTSLLDSCALPHPEHSQRQTKVLWSAFFCPPWSDCMKFFATHTQTSTGM